jgi:antiviral helicase SLH1
VESIPTFLSSSHHHSSFWHSELAMAPSVDTAASQWLEQLQSMRQAIAELNLPPHDKAQEYGHDLVDDDEDFSSGIEDAWDLISDDEEETDFPTDGIDGFSSTSTAAPQNDKTWLRSKCEELSQKGSTLDARTLEDQVIASLSSDSGGRFFDR